MVTSHHTMTTIANLLLCKLINTVSQALMACQRACAKSKLFQKSLGGWVVFNKN